MTLTNTMKLFALASVTACASAAAPASAGQWQLNPRLCPDLVEDRIDQRVTLSRQDIREDIRDARRVNCPASAWVYTPAPGERVARAIAYSGPTFVYVGRRGYYQYPPRRGLRLRRPSPVRVNVIIR
ncbi:MAG: hypothetical protein AAGJ29_04760 [Pseudomonadota bacterium]